MRIVILHPAVPPEATLEDQDSMVQVEAIAEGLRRLGHEAEPLPCTLDLAGVRRKLLARPPAVVFNLVESVDGADSLQYLPPALLDAMGIRYTGAPTEALFQTTHKLLAKQLLHLAGLPTPAWIVADSEPEGPPLPPDSACILKAVWEHASRGLDEGNIITAPQRDGLADRLRQFHAQSGRPCFAEQFVEGREFNLSVLGGPAGPEVLPCAEIDFSAFPPGKPRIVGHRAKWEADSFEFHHTPRRFDFSPGDDELLARLQHLAGACWRLFGLRGYARVDFRVDRQGQPWILEINANPCLSPDAGFVAAAGRAGLSYEAMLQRILDEALLPAPAGRLESSP
ncbi:MAG: hypothetical protein ACLQLG_14350 [Thermoguttaceae bacterium]